MKDEGSTLLPLTTNEKEGVNIAVTLRQWKVVIIAPTDTNSEGYFYSN